MDNYDNNLPEEVIVKNKESEEIFMQYSTEQLRYELKRRNYIAHMEKQKTENKYFDMIKMSGEVVAIYKHNRPFDRWEYRVKDIEVLTPTSKPFTLDRKEQSDGIVLTLAKHFFKDKETPLVGDKVRIQFADTPNCDKVWKMKAKIVSIIRPDISIENELKY